MISIGTIKKELKNNKVRVYSDVKIDNEIKRLFYETESTNEEYISDEKADGFLVGLLVVALKKHYDIVVESPVSERLLYGINKFIIPALVSMNAEFKPINIHCKQITTKIPANINGVATAVSGGVDSFYTILNHIDMKVPKSKRLTHLVLFNAGNYGLDYDIARKQFIEQIEYTKQICDSLKLPLVCVNSNLMEFVKFPFEQVHTFCNISCALVLQKLIQTYYYSSGYSLNKFKLDFSDNSYYDLINGTAFKTESFEMISFGGLTSRFEKTKYVANYRTVELNLDVCLKPKQARLELKKNNCSKCSKCIRTMTNLDVIGKLDNFDKVFDLDLYYRNRSKYWGYLRYFKFRINNEFARENIKNAKEMGYKIPLMSNYWMFHTGFKNQILKFK